MRKLAVVTQIFPVREQPYRGHSVVQTLLKLKRWIDVEVFSPQARYPAYMLPKTRAWASTDLSYAPSSLKAKYIDYPALPIFSRPFNGLACARRIAPFIAAARPDIILSYWIYPDGFAALQIARHIGVPVVVKSIGSDLNERRDPVSTALVKYVLRHADAVLTVSEQLRQKAIHLGAHPRNVVMIPNGCDSAVFRCSDRRTARQDVGLPTEQQLILYVGRLDFKKGLRELIKAFSRMLSPARNLRLALIGEGPARSELEHLANQRRIGDRVLFVSPCNSSRVACWMAAADIVTLPSYAEGCPNVVLEALSCGRPVVASSVGAIPDLVREDCGILVQPGDAMVLAAALESALNRSWNNAEISGQCRRGWEEVADEVYSVCDKLMPSRAESPPVHSSPGSSYLG